MAMGAIAVLAAMSILGVGVLGTAGMMAGSAPAGMTGGGMMGGGMGGMHGGGMTGGMGGTCDMNQMQNHTAGCDMPMDPGQCHCCGGDGDGV